MLNYLMDCSKNTPIGQLPEIINNNNRAIEDEFSWIFDASSNRLTKSVYAPTGSVKAHFGEFANLYAEQITVKNTDSVSNIVVEALKKTPHKKIADCFNESLSEITVEQYLAAGYLHDTSTIVDASTGDSLSAIITELYQRIEALESQLAELNNSNNE